MLARVGAREVERGTIGGADARAAFPSQRAPPVHRECARLHGLAVVVCPRHRLAGTRAANLIEQVQQREVAARAVERRHRRGQRERIHADAGRHHGRALRREGEARHGQRASGLHDVAIETVVPDVAQKRAGLHAVVHLRERREIGDHSAAVAAEAQHVGAVHGHVGLAVELKVEHGERRGAVHGVVPVRALAPRGVDAPAAPAAAQLALLEGDAVHGLHLGREHLLDPRRSLGVAGGHEGSFPLRGGSPAARTDTAPRPAARSALCLRPEGLPLIHSLAPGVSAAPSLRFEGAPLVHPFAPHDPSVFGAIASFFGLGVPMG